MIFKEYEFKLYLPYIKPSGAISQREMEMLYDLYSGRFSKFTAFLTYLYQGAVLKNGKSEEEIYLGKCMEEISSVELSHIKMIADAIYSFGGDPVFMGRFNYFTTGYVNYVENVEDILISNMEGEKYIVEKIKELCGCTQNSSLYEFLTRISLDDELHQHFFMEIYEEFAEFKKEKL